jgi:hypothetical protein
MGTPALAQSRSSGTSGPSSGRRRRGRARTATSRSGTSCSCSCVARRHARPAAEPVRRHRGGARPTSRCSRAESIWDIDLLRPLIGGRAGDRSRIPGFPGGDRTCPCASWPNTPAPLTFLVSDESCRATRKRLRAAPHHPPRFAALPTSARDLMTPALVGTTIAVMGSVPRSGPAPG